MISPCNSKKPHSCRTIYTIYTVVQYTVQYANLSLLFARYHAKIIPWGHKIPPDFVAVGFQDSDEDEDEDDHEE
jgi:hypothetical protein